MTDTSDDMYASSSRVEEQVAYDDEEVIWQGRPSQWVNFGEILFWSLIMVVAFTFQHAWQHMGYGARYATYETAFYTVFYIMLIIPPVMMLWAWLSVHYEKTFITRNKITEVKGITRLFAEGRDCEIAKIEDIVMPPAGLLALVGRASLVLITSDKDQPRIIIRAIRDRDAVKHLIYPIWRKLYIERKGFFPG